MSRYCASCGTEVDDTAIFCPTCGQPIDQEVETAIPPAPGWPDPSDAAAAEDPYGAPTRPFEPPADAPPAPGRGWSAAPNAEPEPEPVPRQPEPIRPVSERRATPDAEAPMPPERAAAPPSAPAPVDRTPAPASAPAAPAAPAPAQPSPTSTASPLASLPITAPVTLSGWLVGVGAGVAAIGALISLFDSVGAVVDLLLLIALAAVALSVFFSAVLPAFAQLRLATLAIVLVAFGAAMDRLLVGIAGAGELLLFLGTAAAVIGVLLLELGRDQPLGGPHS